jgi:hypothetical protein
MPQSAAAVVVCFTDFGFDLAKNPNFPDFSLKTVFPPTKYSGTLSRGIGVDSSGCRICQLRK